MPTAIDHEAVIRNIQDDVLESRKELERRSLHVVVGNFRKQLAVLQDDHYAEFLSAAREMVTESLQRPNPSFEDLLKIVLFRDLTSRREPAGQSRKRSR